MFNSLDRLATGFKILGDENRLKIIALLNNQERNVGEIATLLGISEPTVSHHLSKLREMGLVNLRQVGNQRRYILNEATLSRWKQQVAALEDIDYEPAQVEPDNQWIEALALDEADKKVLRDYMVGVRLKHIPVKFKKLMAVLRWLATEFEPDVLYTEREVNEILTRHHEDYARLRRELIEADFLRRERGGATYWKA